MKKLNINQFKKYCEEKQFTEIILHCANQERVDPLDFDITFNNILVFIEGAQILLEDKKDIKTRNYIALSCVDYVKIGETILGTKIVIYCKPLCDIKKCTLIARWREE